MTGPDIAYAVAACAVFVAAMALIGWRVEADAHKRSEAISQQLRRDLTIAWAHRQERDASGRMMPLSQYQRALLERAEAK